MPDAAAAAVDEDDKALESCTLPTSPVVVAMLFQKQQQLTHVHMLTGGQPLLARGDGQQHQQQQAGNSAENNKKQPTSNAKAEMGNQVGTVPCVNSKVVLPVREKPEREKVTS